jgi:hypothetical protein
MHTAGPWKVLRLPGAASWGVVPVDKRGKPRNGRDTEDVCQGENIADAYLIAAAPDLLAALQCARFHLAQARTDAVSAGGKNCEGAKFFDEPLRQAAEAIAKAKGR